MNELQIFKNEDFGEIRSLIVDNEPWFVGKDVAEALGYKNTKDALISHVDKEDKKIIQKSEIATLKNNIPKEALQINFVLSDIPNRGLTIINESGLYSLILSSKLSTAKKFKRWVTSEVLPAIRKTGQYQVPSDPMEALKLMFEAQTQTKKDVANHDFRITELEENKLLTPGEYNYLNHQVRNRIKTIKEVKKLTLSSKQNSKLYSFINRDLNMLVGIRTRSQFRAKDFEKALDFISNWNPSYTDLKIIEEITE